MNEPTAVPDHLLHRSIRVRVVRDVFEIIAFAAAGIWAIWTFWYQASYAPKHEVPAVDWKLTLEIIGRKPTGELAVKAVVKAKNTGKAIERLAGIVVNISGVRMAADPGSDPFGPVVADTLHWHGQVGSRLLGRVLVASDGDRYGDGAELTIQPDEDWMWETSFVIQPADYAMLEGHMAETTIMGGAPIKTSWFHTVRGPDGMSLVATDECRAARDCRVSSSFDITTLSLWSGAVGAPP